MNRMTRFAALMAVLAAIQCTVFAGVDAYAIVTEARATDVMPPTAHFFALCGFAFVWIAVAFAFARADSKTGTTGKTSKTES